MAGLVPMLIGCPMNQRLPMSSAAPLASATMKLRLWVKLRSVVQRGPPPVPGRLTVVMLASQHRFSVLPMFWSTWVKPVEAGSDRGSSRSLVRSR